MTLWRRKRPAFAVFEERESLDGRPRIDMYCATFDTLAVGEHQKRRQPDFEHPDPLCADQPPCAALRAVYVHRYESLNRAIRTVNNRKSSSPTGLAHIRVAGVVPIDEGGHEYSLWGRGVKIGSPLYAVDLTDEDRPIPFVEDRLAQGLAVSAERQLHWLCEYLHDTPEQGEDFTGIMVRNRKRRIMRLHWELGDLQGFDYVGALAGLHC